MSLNILGKGYLPVWTDPLMVLCGCSRVPLNLEAALLLTRSKLSSMPSLHSKQYQKSASRGGMGGLKGAT